jgi:hypothetical protein
MNDSVLLNIPTLDRPFEMLWRHYFIVSTFGGLKQFDGHGQAYRHTLVYLITKASRDYQKAREIVLAHHGLIAGPQANMVIVEFPFVFEDCINSAHRAIDIGDRLVNEGKLSSCFKIQSHQGAAKKTRTLRDMIQHIVPRVLHNRGQGPIRLSPSEDGAYVQLANFKLRFTEIVEVLHWLFDAAVSLIPTFDSSSVTEVPAGPLNLVCSVTVTTVPRENRLHEGSAFAGGDGAL